jgi:hypothetical protein
MVTNKDSIKKLLEKGIAGDAIREIVEDNIEIDDIQYDGINVVTASIMANVGVEKKLGLIEEIGRHVTNDAFSRLMKHKFISLHPEKAHALMRQGIQITPAIEEKYSEEFDIFDFIFPYLPLSLGSDILKYAVEKKGLTLTIDEIERMKACAGKRRNYSEKEIDEVFDSIQFDSGKNNDRTRKNQ